MVAACLALGTEAAPNSESAPAPLTAVQGRADGLVPAITASIRRRLLWFDLARRLATAAVIVAFLASFLAVREGAALGSTSPDLQMHPCVEGRSRVPAECGTFRVYENRAAHAGRTIDLGFILLKAQHRSGHAIYFNPGGPGGPTTPYATLLTDKQPPKYAKPLWILRDRYDILLLDNRGMGESHSLDCSSIYSQVDPAPYYLEIWPSTALRACRALQAEDSDLSQYTTDNAVEDLNDLRAALGYRKIVLAGDSGGTYFSLIYMRRHPGSVESALLNGVAPPHLLIVPLDDAYGAQLAMNDVIRECAADVACHTNFPLLAQHFAALARRFDRGPIAITIRNGSTHRLERVLLSKEVFADRLRQALYFSGFAKYVPLAIERAYRGNYLLLGELIDSVTFFLAKSLDTGANLSYTCAEHLPFITPAMIARASAGSFQGDTRVRAQQRACAIWNVRPVPVSENTIVRSTLPVLMVSGTNDPASPAIFAQQELPYLPNARLVLQRGASHTEESDCTVQLEVAFVLARSAKGLNTTSCASSFHRPPFVLSYPGA